MAVVVENGRDQIEAYTTGNGIFPVPAEVAADNAKQEAKSSGKNEPEAAKPDTKDSPKVESVAEKSAEAEDDDKEGEDGLTPRQKREFTKAMQATIGKKHRMQREAEEFAQSQYQEAKLAEARAAKLEADLAALREQLKPAPTETIKEPARADFKDDQAYWDAMVDFRVDKKLRDQQAAAAKRADEEFQAEAAAHAQAKMDRALDIGPDDFKEVYDSADIMLPNYVLNAIKDSDLMPELVYELAINREKAEKIAALTNGLRAGSPAFAKAAQRQLVEIGKIESTLTPFAKEAKVKSEDAPAASQKTAKAESETESAPSKPRVNAPIIKPLNGGSASQVEKDEADLTGSQVLTRWQKKHGVVLTARKRH